MNSNFGLQEQFDIELKKSDPTDSLSFKGVMQIVHKREGEVLSVDTGSNIITETGKAELVRLMGQLVLADGATGAGGDAPDPMAFHYIGLGRRGDIQASASDKMLGGSLTQSFTKDNLITYANPAQQAGYYVDAGCVGGYEYNGVIVNDNTSPTAVVTSPRAEGDGTSGTTTVSETSTKLFYHGISETTIPEDTLLWHGQFVFSNINDGTNEYTTPTITINEAGIFNRSHAYAKNGDGTTPSGANPTVMPVMLARRTFSDKPVKNADELTIKWQITIK